MLIPGTTKLYPSLSTKIQVSIQVWLGHSLAKKLTNMIFLSNRNYDLRTNPGLQSSSTPVGFLVTVVLVVVLPVTGLPDGMRELQSSGATRSLPFWG